MSFNTGAALLDAIVLAVVGREETGTYGYRITQDVRAVLDISESTLYPVLRRLQKDGCLTVHDEPSLLPNHTHRPCPAGGVSRRMGRLHSQDRPTI